MGPGSVKQKFLMKKMTIFLCILPAFDYYKLNVIEITNERRKLSLEEGDALPLFLINYSILGPIARFFF
jgi:hypothetical protein